MQNKNEWIRKLGEQVEILVAEPMKNHTTFRIGGPADLFLLPNTVEEIKKIREICIQEQESYFILGNGSNLLVSDSGFRGVIIQTYRNLQIVLSI